MKYKVALTGGIGSGKTTLSQLFEKQGVTVVDADIIAREVVLPGSSGLNQLVQHFGQAILNEDGTLNRSSLRDMMFNETKSAVAIKQQVNDILHPLIKELTLQHFNQVTSPYVLWVVPLLFENKLHTQANRVLVIDVPEKVQLERTLKRDGVNESQVKKIIESQITREERLKLADDIVNGDVPIERLQMDVSKLHHSYLQLADKFKNNK